MSKKEMLVLGMLAIGGIGAASMLSDSSDGGAALTPTPRAGGILGSTTAPGTEGAVYNIPAAAAVTFPKAPTFDISKFLEPLAEPTISRGAAGVSAAPKKEITPYLYTGGEIKAGAVSVAPWAMGVTTPTEIGVTTALKMAKKDDPSTWRTRKEFMSTAPTGGRGYPGMSKKETASLSATKERLSK